MTSVGLDQFKFGNAFIDELLRGLDDNMSETMLIAMSERWHASPDDGWVSYTIDVPDPERDSGPSRFSGRIIQLRFTIETFIMVFRYEFGTDVDYGIKSEYSDPKFDADRVAKIIDSFYKSQDAGRWKYTLLDMKESGWIRTEKGSEFSSKMSVEKWF